MGIADFQPSPGPTRTLTTPDGCCRKRIIAAQSPKRFTEQLCSTYLHIRVNSHAAQIPIARSYKNRLVIFNSFFVGTIEISMREQHFCDVDPFDNHHCWTFRGHDCWVAFARHSKDSLNLKCLALAREPHAHVFLKENSILSFGAMSVGAPAPFATVTFPMRQIQVRRSHSLI